MGRGPCLILALSNSCTFPTASTAAWDDQPAIRAQHAERFDEFPVLRRRDPCEQASCQLVRRVRDAIFDAFTREKRWDHPPGAATHRLKSHIWEISHLFSQYLDGRRVKLTVHPNRAYRSVYVA